MKLTITNGTVVVASENKREASELFNRYFGVSLDGPVEIIVDQKRKASKKHKRHLFTKRCRYCNKACRGGTGLSSHERACLKKQTSESLSLLKIPTDLLS